VGSPDRGLDQMSNGDLIPQIQSNRLFTAGPSHKPGHLARRSPRPILYPNIFGLGNMTPNVTAIGLIRAPNCFDGVYEN